MFKYVIAFICVFPVFLTQAQSTIPHEQLVDAANHKTWRKLLLLDQHDKLNQSGIHSQSFFLSNKQQANALDELIATITAFSLPVSGDPNLHAQCKFKGRYMWLKSQLGSRIAPHEVAICPDYDEWTSNNSTDSISVIFATGYLGNPASYYGHTLLKLNSSKIKKSTKLEDVSLNYGAIIDGNDGPIPYILKGLFGGYDAGFSHIQYYFHTHNYGENELRDLWEYELNLTPTQLSLILGHAWEVLGQKYTYFFLDKNCVYRMAELLEIIDGIDIIPDNPIGIIPQAMIQKLNNSHLNGKPLITNISYHPSRQSRFYQRFNTLGENTKNVLIKKVDDDISFDSPDFTKLALSDKYQVIDTLLDYYQFLTVTDDDNAKVHNERYRLALTQRFSLPIGKSDVQYTPPESPHLGRNPTLLQVGVKQHKEFGNSLQIKLRPAYYDALDYQQGHVPNSALSMAQITLSLANNRSRLEALSLVKIESINGRNTGLPGDKSAAWKLAFGWKQASNECENSCLVPSLSASYGYSSINYRGLVAGVFVGGSLQENTLNKGSAVANASLFIDYAYNEQFKTRFAVEHESYPITGAASTNKISLTSHYQINHQWGVRAFILKEENKEFGLSLGYYF